MTEPNIYVIEPQTGYWLATVPAVMGCNASGKTRDEAIANVRKTFTAYLALLTARGVSIEHWKGLDPDRFPVATNPPASPLFPEDEIPLEEHDIRDFLHLFEVQQAALIALVSQLSPGRSASSGRVGRGFTPGIGLPCGHVSGFPRTLMSRSSISSLIACSIRSASSCVFHQS